MRISFHTTLTPKAGLHGIAYNAAIMSCTQPLLLYVAQSKVRGLATSFVLCTVKNKVFGNWLSTAPCPLKKAFVPFLSDISSIIELESKQFHLNITPHQLSCCKFHENGTIF